MVVHVMLMAVCFLPSMIHYGGIAITSSSYGRLRAAQHGSNRYSCCRAPPPTSSHLDPISRRTRRRRRGEAAGERASNLDVMLAAPPTTHLARHQRPSKALPAPPFQYVCVLDVEATCDEFTNNYQHEIIEFPVVLVDLLAEDGPAAIAEFRSFVRPTVNTTLTEFCTRLTGITQGQVDSAPTLPEVLAAFEVWRIAKGLEYTDENKNFAFAADGPFDLRFFLAGECTRKGIPLAAYYAKWVNIKSMFAEFYNTRNLKIHKMLERQNLKFEGRLHSGIDDTRNIARILIKMRNDGCHLYVNEQLPKRFELTNLA